jgi:hypothetical protein
VGSYLTTFWTPVFRYRWLRMPFGIKPAAEEYQGRQCEALQGLKWVWSQMTFFCMVVVTYTKRATPTAQEEVVSTDISLNQCNMVSLIALEEVVSTDISLKQCKLLFHPIIAHTMSIQRKNWKTM